jgi:hypothetical protein
MDGTNRPLPIGWLIELSELEVSREAEVLRIFITRVRLHGMTVTFTSIFPCLNSWIKNLASSTMRLSSEFERGILMSQRPRMRRFDVFHTRLSGARVPLGSHTFVVQVRSLACMSSLKARAILMYDRSSARLNDVRPHRLAVRAGIRDEGAFIQTESQKLVEPRAGTAGYSSGLSLGAVPIVLSVMAVSCSACSAGEEFNLCG